MKKELKRILCIDDEDSILAVTQMTLETVGGFEVTTCTRGKEALLKVKEIKPQLIILDVMMPEMDGIETMAELKKLSFLNKSPIILMTARVQPKEVEEYMDKGAAGVISKPFDPMMLSKEVIAIWDRFNS